jgi:predicted peptidase
MKFGSRTILAVTFAALATLLILNIPETARAQAPDAAKGGGKGGARFAQDPRAQARTYHFADTNEDLPYSVFVSSKVKPGQKAPMVVTLHGLGAPQTIMMSKTAVDLAEEGGYILVAPMGYNVGGWYGSPVINMNGRGPGGVGKGPAAPPPAAAPKPPYNLAELSEKDVMNVIGMARKEFNIDDKRMYLMGHSMGGAGTLFLGSKHSGLWAAIGAEAPAAFMMNNNRAEILGKLKAANVPVMIVQGDADELVPVANSRMWVETMKELKMDHEYVEQPGVGHGPVIQSGMNPIFEFFAKHKK